MLTKVIVRNIPLPSLRYLLASTQSLCGGLLTLLNTCQRLDWLIRAINILPLTINNNFIFSPRCGQIKFGEGVVEASPQPEIKITPRVLTQLSWKQNAVAATRSDWPLLGAKVTWEPACSDLLAQHVPRIHLRFFESLGRRVYVCTDRNLRAGTAAISMEPPGDTPRVHATWTLNYVRSIAQRFHRNGGLVSALRLLCSLHSDLF